MTDTIQVEISSEQPAVAASLSELRYLVFQGMIGPDGKSAYELAVELGFEGTEEEWIASLKGEIGPAGAPGTTLGWDVTDDGEGNVEMTYPESQEGDTNAVRFVQQTLTPAQQTQARENIGAAAEATAENQLALIEKNGNYLQALRRKLLGMTSVLRTAYNTRETVNGMRETLNGAVASLGDVETTLEEMAFSVPLATDANAVITSGSVRFARYNGNTLNTPYKQGISTWQQGMILSFSNGNAWQLAAPIGAAAVYIRSGASSGGTITFNSWVRLLTSQDYTALDQRISALEGQ